MDNFNEQDIDELRTLAKKYFEMEKSVDPLLDQLDKIKELKREKEKEIKNRNEEISYVKDQIMVLLQKNEIDSLKTNKGKFKIHKPNPKIIKFKQKEIRENLEKLLSTKLNTTDEENKQIYKELHNKGFAEQPSQLRIYKPKEKKEIMLF